MNPRFKLVLLAVVSTTMLLFTDMRVVLALLAVSLLHIIHFRIGAKLALWVKPMALVFAGIVVMQAFTFSGFGFSYAGLYEGVLYSLRLLVLVAFVSIFIHTTSMSGIAYAFGWLPKPISQVFVLSLSYLPVLTVLTENILRAQRSRGLSFRSPNVFRTYFPVLVPLFAKSLERSNSMSLAMQSRGFEG